MKIFIFIFKMLFTYNALISYMSLKLALTWWNLEFKKPLLISETTKSNGSFYFWLYRLLYAENFKHDIFCIHHKHIFGSEKFYRILSVIFKYVFKECDIDYLLKFLYLLYVESVFIMEKKNHTQNYFKYSQAKIYQYEEKKVFSDLGVTIVIVFFFFFFEFLFIHKRCESPTSILIKTGILLKNIHLSHIIASKRNLKHSFGILFFLSYIDPVII